MNGERGSVEVTGKNLNSETIEAVAKSTAGTGNTASAKIQAERDQKAIQISLKGDPAKVAVDSELRNWK